MSHSTTTLDHIVALSEEEQRLLNQTEWTTEDRAQCAEIQKALRKLWPIRRAELVFERNGPPRIISAPDPRSQKQIARGIAPLPQGGD
jgi:hypothetical protein